MATLNKTLQNRLRAAEVQIVDRRSANEHFVKIGFFEQSADNPTTFKECGDETGRQWSEAEIDARPGKRKNGKITAVLVMRPTREQLENDV